MKIKINYMKTHSDPSDDEIRSYMNFDRLAEDARKQSNKNRLRKAWVSLPIALALVSVWLVTINHKQDEKGKQQTVVVNNDADTLAESGSTNQSTRKQDRGPIIDPTASEKTTRHDDQQAQVLSQEATRSEKLTGDTRSGRPAVDQPAEETHPTPSPRSVVESKDAYVQAEPRDGYAQLYTYFNDHLLYPPQAIKDSVEGIETVSFTIDVQGKPTNIAITQSLGRYFDEEAVRLISEMPHWKPATLNGRPVASQLSVPLTFELERIKKP